MHEEKTGAGTEMKRMEFKFLKISLEDSCSIWICTIDNPPVNTITPIMLNELEALLIQFQNDIRANVLILTGAGDRAFCAGADITEIMKIKNSETGLPLAILGQKVCSLFENSDKLVIAAINGLCLGGGNELALSCHLRLASERAKFGQTEVNLGLLPGWGGTQRLPRLIGLSKARKLILTGDFISAEEAFNCGLVDEIIEHAKVLEQAIRLARRINRKSQSSVRLSQRALREGYKQGFEKGLEVELECFRQICDTEDMKEGLKAYKEKREPIFKNR